MNDFTLFNWKSPSLNDPNKWVLATTVTKYTPNGEPLEDKNILNIYSTALYGYNNTLPVAVAQNAQEGTVLFESFENVYQNSLSNRFYLENGYEITAGVKNAIVSSDKHTGSKSLLVAPNTVYTIGELKCSNEKVLSKLWIRSSSNSEKLKNQVYLIINNQPVKMKFVSGAGQWMQFEAEASCTGQATVGVQVVPLTGVNFGQIYIDDIRCQPYSSEMVCYVYDKAQRLVAAFDDRHYALLYQYNSEGALVRKLKETVEGVKTISETQYNTKGERRPTN
jgi:hypothetical protein